MNTNASNPGRDAFLAFDPNKPDHRPWATYAERRTVKFKMHSTRASALQVFAQYRDLAALYQWENNPVPTRPGAWSLFARKDKEAQDCRCDHCGLPTVEHKQLRYTYAMRKVDEAQWGKDAYDTGEFVWARKSPGRTYKPGKLLEPLRMLYVCAACQQFMR